MTANRNVLHITMVAFCAGVLAFAIVSRAKLPLTADGCHARIGREYYAAGVDMEMNSGRYTPRVFAFKFDGSTGLIEQGYADRNKARIAAGRLSRAANNNADRTEPAELDYASNTWSLPDNYPFKPYRGEGN